MIAVSTFQRESVRADRFASKCPHFDIAGEICRASSSALAVDRGRRAYYCTSEDHDDCAIFLAKFLRMNRPVCYGMQPGELEAK